MLMFCKTRQNRAWTRETSQTLCILVYFVWTYSQTGSGENHSFQLKGERAWCTAPAQLTSCILNPMAYFCINQQTSVPSHHYVFLPRCSPPRTVSSSSPPFPYRPPLNLPRPSFHGSPFLRHGSARPLFKNTAVLRQPRFLPQSGSTRYTMALIRPESFQTLFCVLASCAAFGQIMETKTNWGARISAPLLAMLLGMALSGAQIIPNTSASYNFVFSSIMPMAVALCLLETDVQSIFTNAGSTLKAFWYGAFGTIIGTLVAFKIVGPALGIDGWKIASSLCASYIGGTINYAATAQALGLTSASTLAAGMAADNLAMAAYFSVLMSIPDSAYEPTHDYGQEGMISEISVMPTVESVSLSLAAAAIACVIGNAVAALLPASTAGCGLAITAFITSCFSAAGAHFHRGTGSSNMHAFAGSQLLGSSLMLLYFSVVGASAGFKDAFFGGWSLLVFIFILILIHLGIILSLGNWSKLPTRMVLVASNANIGGPGTAAAMASCRGWRGLVRPALLVGTLGYMVGTGIGCLLGVHFLQPLK